MFSRNRKIEVLRIFIEELEEKNQRYRNALEFYANASNWEEAYKYRGADDVTVFADKDSTAITEDRGLIAKQALRDV